MAQEEHNSQLPETEKPNNGDGKKGGDLKARLLTAIFIAALYIVPIALDIYVYPLFYDALILFLMIAASVEFARAISIKFAPPIMVFVIVNILLGYAAFKTVNAIFGENGGITTYFSVLAVVFISCIVFNMINTKYTINNVISTLFVMIYPGAIMSYLLALNYMHYGAENSFVAVITAFVVSVLTDTMAYVVGSTVRGPKLCPRISPKKTISGAVGGLLFGGVGGGLVVFLFAKYNLFKCLPLLSATIPNVLNFMFLGLGASLFCQLGDLISSYVKRAAGIKDYGTVLKGHGGFMDRIDGLIISAVFVFIYFTIFGVVV